jgi:hypothetical protein
MSAQLRTDRQNSVVGEKSPSLTMSAGSITFRALGSMHSVKSTLSLSLKIALSNQGSFALIDPESAQFSMSVNADYNS